MQHELNSTDELFNIDLKFGVFENESKIKYSFVKDADVFFGILVTSILENLSYSLGVFITGYTCIMLFCRDRKHNVTTIYHLILTILLTNFVLVGYVPMIIWREYYSASFALTITMFHISSSLIAFYVLQIFGNYRYKITNMFLAVLMVVIGHFFRFMFQSYFMDINDPVIYHSLLSHIKRSI
jgi:hypothetical protein